MKYSDYIVQGNRVSYHGIPVIVDEILNKSHDYSPDKEELNRFPSLCHVGIIYDDWKTDIVIATALRPLRAMSCLSFDELKTLWGQITIGYMLNYDCYNNSLGVNRVEVEHYATGFLDALNDNDEYPEFMENSPENFATYCCWSE